jgi:hypothetical protein
MDWRDDPERRPEQERPRPPTKQALRLTFEYDGDDVKLVGTQRLQKVVPPMIGDPPEEGRHSGEWIQIHDADGRQLFTRLLNDPLRTRVEVHDPDTGPYIVTGPPGQGTFDVLVPDLPGAAAVVLYASPAPEREALRPARRIARFDLRSAPDK